MKKIVRWVVPFALASAACTGDKVTLPELSERARSSATLVNFDSCDRLEQELKSSLREQMRVQLLQLADTGPVYMLAEDGAKGGAEPNSSGQAETRQAGVDYSGTNNQEAGVDESDFVKTDGFFIYLINGSRLEILGTPTAGTINQVSTTELEGWPQEMLLSGDRLVVFSSVNAYSLAGDDPLRPYLLAGSDSSTFWWRLSDVVKLTVFDLNDRAHPSVIRQLYIEGYYQTARLVDSSVRMVSHGWIDVPDLVYYPELDETYWNGSFSEDEMKAAWRRAVAKAIRHNDSAIANASLADLVPQIYERSGDNIAVRPYTEQACANFSMAEDGMSRGVTSILSLDVFADPFVFNANHIVSNDSTVYASPTTLLLAEPAQDWWWYWNNDAFEEATNIHRFDISTPGVTTYTGSGRVAGTILGQFALSVYQGYVRVASTTGQWNRWWLTNPAPAENHLFVLGGDSHLATIGHLDGIALGEQLWSSRFVNDRAYLVTFQRIDPMWTVDLSDPANPTLLGDIEVPGVATYIHPLADNRLLTIGLGGDDQGLDWRPTVQLFDVSNPQSPVLTNSLTLSPQNSGWSWSEAMYEHKAFQYWEPLQLLAVPITTSNWGYGAYDYESRLALTSVDPTNGLSLFATVDHSAFFNDGPYTYWYRWDIRRSIFMRDQSSGEHFVYAVSDRGITVHRLSDMHLMTSVELPGAMNYPYYAF